MKQGEFLSSVAGPVFPVFPREFSSAVAVTAGAGPIPVSVFRATPAEERTGTEASLSAA